MLLAKLGPRLHCWNLLYRRVSCQHISPCLALLTREGIARSQPVWGRALYCTPHSATRMYIRCGLVRYANQPPSVYITLLCSLVSIRTNATKTTQRMLDMRLEAMQNAGAHVCRQPGLVSSSTCPPVQKAFAGEVVCAKITKNHAVGQAFSLAVLWFLALQVLDHWLFESTSCMS